MKPSSSFYTLGKIRIGIHIFGESCVYRNAIAIDTLEIVLLYNKTHIGRRNYMICKNSNDCDCLANRSYLWVIRIMGL